MYTVSKLYNDDCMNILSDLPSKSVTMCLTDIPYGVVNRQDNGLINLNKGLADIETFDLTSFLVEICRVVSGSAYIFCGTEQVSQIRKHFVDSGMSTRLCIWEKTNPVPMNGEYIWLSGIECCVYGKFSGATFNEKCKNSVWRYPIVHDQKHPTQKPLRLFEYLIRTSTNPGDVVLDPCLGSGTTAIACINSGRHYIGIEKDQSFFEVAQRRINAHGKISKFKKVGLKHIE